MYSTTGVYIFIDVLSLYMKLVTCLLVCACVFDGFCLVFVVFFLD